jgi:hydroxymethylglutaryl-CoA lyase
MANVYAGLEEGVDIFDCSIGGLGGCPFAKGAAGNVPTEDVAFLCEELGVQTGLDLDKLGAAAALAEDIVGFSLPGKFYKTWRARCGG